MGAEGKRESWNENLPRTLAMWAANPGYRQDTDLALSLLAANTKRGAGEKFIQ